MTLSGFMALTILVTIGILVFVELAGMPGRAARKRNHPETEAIAMLGWLGLPLGIVPWLIAMIWARMTPLSVNISRSMARSAVTEPGEQDDSAAS